MGVVLTPSVGVSGACSKMLGEGSDVRSILGSLGGSVPVSCGVMKGGVFVSTRDG